MKILVIGGGGREHALVWKLSQSSRVEKIYCAPGNGGTAEIAENVDIDVEDIIRLADFAEKKNLDITIVGPELPLVMGISDIFRKRGLNIVGPGRQGAMLEGSKAFSKDFMAKYNIPTASYNVVDRYAEARRIIENSRYPLVIKADGLAAGKGVYICNDKDEAMEALDHMMIRKIYDEAGRRVVIEEFLEGIETSVLCFTDGETIIPMTSAKDYKRAYDMDRGPNTGGMGCVSPNPIFTQDLQQQIQTEILDKFIAGLRAEAIDFRGIIYVGVIVTDKGPYVLEFNTRFGDPETQVLMPRLKTDLVDICEWIINKDLRGKNIEWYDDSCCTVILASGGYPKEYKKGLHITIGEDTADEALLFHSGTKLEKERLLTSGGRVMAVTALGETLDKAIEGAYRMVDTISFDGMEYRKDIGK